MIRPLIAFFLVLFVCSASSWARIDFDGTDDYVDAGTVTNLTATTTTISAWINLDSNTIQQYFVVQQNSGATANNGVLLWSPGATGTGRFAMTGNLQLASPVFRHASDSTLSTSTTYHVLGTWDGTNTATGINLYVNGSETSYAVTTNGSGTPTSSTGKTIFGGGTAVANRFMNGRLWEIAVWNVVLNAQEIAHLANSRVRGMSLQIRPASLIGYWPLDDQPDGASADADTLADYGPSRFNATGVDGANNTGLASEAERTLSFP